jgi:hypothetical protein
MNCLITRGGIQEKEVVMQYGSQFDLVLRETAGKGKGVFTNEDIAEGSRIFTNLVMPIPEQELEGFENSFLRCHLVHWDTTFAVGLGISIYLNHSNTPNVKFVRHYENDLIEAFSLVSIPKGTELTHRYANPHRHPGITS